MYDDLVRISSVNCGPTSPNGSTWTQSFTYDPFGNINKSGSLSFLPTYTGSASTPTTNQFYQIPGGPAGASNYYDLNGNLTTDVTNTYSWDADGNSVKINSIGLAYDALDRRVEQNNAGTYTQILYSPIGSARLESNMAEHEYGDLAYAPFGESYAILNTPYPSFTGSSRTRFPGPGCTTFFTGNTARSKDDGIRRIRQGSELPILPIRSPGTAMPTPSTTHCATKTRAG